MTPHNFSRSRFRGGLSCSTRAVGYAWLGSINVMRLYAFYIYPELGIADCSAHNLQPSSKGFLQEIPMKLTITQKLYKDEKSQATRNDERIDESSVTRRLG